MHCFFFSFGYEFNQSLEGVAWPSCLQSIEFSWFGALKRVNWPSSLQRLVVWGSISELVEMDLPRGLQMFECRFEADEEDDRIWMVSTSEDRMEE